MSNRVLICDDSLLMRRMIAQALDETGWECIGEAENGEEAIHQFEKLRPDAVTMDIVMPEADGIHGLKGIMKIDPDAKVVVISAVDQSSLISEAIRKGARDFIAKPFMPEQLQQTLDSCVVSTSAE